MSIATAIQNAQQRVANAYTAVDDKGGTLPATQNLTNLPEAIRSIPSGGGGGGQTVNAKAAAGTDSYTTNDKVILIPTDDLYDDSNATYANAITYSSGNYLYMTTGWGYLDYSTGVIAPLAAYSVASSQQVAFCHWSSDYSTFASTTTTTISSTNPFYCITYSNGCRWVMRATSTYYGNPKAETIGVIRDDGSMVQLTFSSVEIGYGGGCVSVKNFAKLNLYGWDKHLFVFNSNGTITDLTGTYAGSIPSYFNGTWYWINASTVATIAAPTTKVYNCTGYRTYYDGWAIRFFDDNVDYFFEYDYQNSPHQWCFRKVTKSTSGWSISTRNDIMASYLECVSTEGVYDVGDRGRWDILSKDHGDKVESFVYCTKFGYDSSGNGNKVAHFMFNKSTETVERLPDVFTDVPDTFTDCGGIQVNWDLGLIAVKVHYRDTSNAVDRCAIYVKKLDGMAGYYKYYAFPNQRQYYISNALTGFVTENEGTDMFNNTVLEVSTVEDPTAPPWTNIGKVFGMEITVNKGKV